MNNSKKDDALTLEILEAIDDRSDLTQRHLADRMGVALGLANSYLKRCVRKGLVKIQQAPANRYLYYLTPKGFAEKSRLTGEYFSSSFDFYRKASEAYSNIFEQCQSTGINKVCLCGISELAEIASLRAQEFSIQIVEVFDPVSTTNKFLGNKVERELNHDSEIQGYVFTALNQPETVYNNLISADLKQEIFVPEFLRYIKNEQ